MEGPGLAAPAGASSRWPDGWPGGWPGGWDEDDHGAALGAFLETADLLPWPGLAEAARAARDGHDARGARAFFEGRFAPLAPAEGLLTGYFEPELEGSLRPTGRFRVPLHARPPGGCDLPRAAIVADGLAAHALAWVEDPLEAFLLQVQGSGRVRLEGGGLLRLGFAGRNGHPYRSIGQALVERGEGTAEAVSTEAIRAWARANPDRLPALLALNASYVFFRDASEVPPGRGPLGAMGRSVTPGRSLAVDPGHVPLGLPVWVEGPGIARLVVAQDTGSAIRGPGRGDLFCGTGAAAGRAAGGLKAPARLTVLGPRP